MDTTFNSAIRGGKPDCNNGQEFHKSCTYRICVPRDVWPLASMRRKKKGWWATVWIYVVVILVSNYSFLQDFLSQIVLAVLFDA